MAEILVTNTEDVSTESDARIRLYGRDAESQRHRVTVTGLEPYFYVKADEARERKQALLGESGIRRFDFDVETDAFGEPGVELARVIVDEPKNVRGAADAFSESWEADVEFCNRYRIDADLYDWIRVPAETVTADEVEIIEAPVEVDPDPRVVVFDIETDDRGGFPEHGEKRVTSIVAYDSYEGEYHGFLDMGGRTLAGAFGVDGEVSSLADLGITECDQLHYESDEKAMLRTFSRWVAERDPDLLSGWNMTFFDAPYIIERMMAVDVYAADLSPEGEAYVNYRDEATVKGRTVYDLLTLYKKNSWTELRSYSLDAVALEELDEQKLHHEEGYFEMWSDDPATLMEYNGRDTRLTAEINDAAGVISFRDRLRKIIGVDFEDTINNYQFIEMLVRRQLKERGEAGPTKTSARGEEYEGGFVVDPYSGLAKNVLGIDLASLYPMTMKMMNLSPEVKLPNYTGEPVPGKVAIAPNGVAFSLEEDGLFREIVDKALELKAEYKDLKKSAPAGSSLEEMYAEMYQVSKTIVNSIYGVVGWVNFFLYDHKTAEAITLSGQAVLKRTKRFVDEETDSKVIYGDTDSNYIKFPDEWGRERCLQETQKICDHLNEVVYPELAESMGVAPEDNEWEIEIEAFMETFFQWGRKKKYSYKATWKEGMEFDEVMDEPEIVIKGSAAKRSDASRLTRDTEKKVIKAILNERPDTEVSDFIYKAGKSLDPTDPDWDNIGIPGGIGKELTDYDTETAHVRAARFSNALLGTEFGKGSKPMRCYVKPFYPDGLDEEVDVIGYEDADDLRPIADRLVPNVPRMTKTLLTNPIGPVVQAYGVDIDAALSGQTQAGLGAFL